MKNFLALVVLAVVVFAPCSSPAGIGITATWSGNGADDNWSTAANWLPPASPPADCDIVFPAGANRLVNNNDIAAGTAFATVTFNGAGGGYDIGGNGFGINEGLTAANTAGDNTIGCDLFISSSLKLTSTTAGTALILTGGLDLRGNTLVIAGAGDVRITGAVSGTPGSIAKVGEGTLELSGENTFNGTTTINEGMLMMSGGGISGSTVTIDGGLLGGSGGTGALTGTGGVISPGTSAGAIAVNGNLSLGQGASLDMEIDGTTATAEYDQFVVTGAVALDGPVLDLTYGYTPQAGDDFIIIDNDGVDTIEGEFDGLPQGASVGPEGVPVVINYDGGDGNDAALMVMTIGIDDVEVTPDDAVAAEAIFSVTLSAPSQDTVTVDYATVDGTAIAPADYTVQSGTLTFESLVVTKTIVVPVNTGVGKEGDKTFSVALANPANGLLVKSSGEGTIHYGGSPGGGCNLVGAPSSKAASLMGLVMLAAGVSACSYRRCCLRRGRARPERSARLRA